MASLFRLGARAVSRQYLRCQTPARVVMQSRSMGSDPYSGMPPTTTLGGQFKNPVGTGHASQEEISEWVKKELEQNWQSKGYDHYDQETDEQWHKLFMFCLVTCPVLLCTIYIYQPDRTMREWATREAYLVLREREAAGLEPLSKDFIDPEKLLAHLPSDDELKEAGVVINI